MKHRAVGRRSYNCYFPAAIATSLLLIAGNSACAFAMALGMGSTAASQLRVLVKSPTSTAVALPGVHDAISAKVYAEAGAKALFLSGFGVSACRLGEPDAGILTLSEMEDAARSVVKAAGGIPVVVDGDTGYGGAANVRRTIRGLAAAGATAVTIEDQVFPKRCTVAAGSGVRVVSREASLARINAAIGARDEAREIDGHDVLLIARTDCRAALGLEEAISRCKAYEDAGADIVYAENLQGRDEYTALRASLDQATPMMLAQVQQEPSNEESNDGAVLTVDEIGEMGYSLALFGVTALQTYVKTLQTTAKNFLEAPGGVLTGDTAKSLSPFSTLKDVVGFPDVDEFEAKYNVDC